MKKLSSPEKEKAKAEKKRAKAVAKAMKKQAEAPNTTVKEAQKEKDWRSNVWMYIVVAIVVGLIVWGITSLLSRFFP